MPLYMDVHRNLGPVTPDDLAAAHFKDVEVQDKYGVAYHKYWLNQDTGTVYCLVEGPNKEACDEVHRRAHGLVADELIEVEPALVEAFMGSGAPNQAGAAVEGDGKLDVGSRIVLFTEVANLAQAASRMGDEAARDIAREHDEAVRAALPRHGGRHVTRTGDGVMACFTSAASALRFAAELQEICRRKHREAGKFSAQLRIGMAAGEPVEADDSLFGVSVTAARRICDLAEPGEVLMSAGVHELAVGKGFKFKDRGLARLRDLDEMLGLYALVSDAGDESAVQPSRARTGFAALVTELRRRHVFTVAAVYATVLFILLQVADLTFEPLKLPPWAFTLLLIVGLFGFPLALVLAWMFDIRQGGIKRTAPDP